MSKKFICFAVAFFMLAAAFGGCTKGDSDMNTSVPGLSNVDYSDFVFTSQTDSGYAVSTLTALMSDGYVADTVNKNIADWLLTAYEKNPGIIDCIKDHSIAKNFNAGTDPVYLFYGEFPGKLLTGMAYAYLLSPSEELKQAGDELTAALAEAQYDDGYLGIFDEDQRFGVGQNWDTWCEYHKLFGLLQWYKVTGNQTAYDTMVKSADGAMAFFAANNRSYSFGTPMCNLAIAHAFALISEVTSQQKYLDEAVKIIENDWKYCGNWVKRVERGEEFYQMTRNYGNRWEVLHSLMALREVGRLTNNETYINAFKTLWQSILKTDRRNTGAFSYGEEALGDLYLNHSKNPNNGSTAVETCCSIAWMAMTTDYLKTTLDSKAADEAELSYYNTMLASLMENCRDVTYNTPSDGSLAKSQTQLSFQTKSFSPDFSCCQANSSRGLAEISQWAVMNTDSAVYLNWYGSSEAHVTTPTGKPLVLTQTTEYPKNGNITLGISGLTENEKFTLCLRVPSWAKSFSVKLGDKTYNAEKFGCYLPITGTWQNGCTVEISIGMAVHYLVGKNDVEGKTSVYYGPILLAADSNLQTLSSVGQIDVTAFDSMEIVNDGNYLLAVKVKNAEGKDVTLISFADVGKNGAFYRSWLDITGKIEALEYVADGKPIWCAFAVKQ